MSLFPAYDNAEKPATSEASKTGESSGVQNDISWLKNFSFPTINSDVMVSLPDESSDEESPEALPQGLEDYFHVTSLISNTWCIDYREKLKYERKTFNNNKSTNNYLRDVKNVYFEDKKSNISNRSFGTLPTKARPEYFYKRCSLGFVPYQFELLKKDSVLRYFAKENDILDTLKKPDNISKRGVPKTSDGQETNILPLLDCLFNEEEEQISLTREFNVQLANSPHDTDLWLRYVKFQDISRKFDKSQSFESTKAICQRKISILDKGLELNPESIELLREKLYLMSELYPADEFFSQIETLIEKNTGNIFLWQTYIMVVQSSVAMCTVPRVLKMYAKCFGTLRLWSRINHQSYDKRLLEMLFHCLTFLRQAGLWEQMWETLRSNLILNFSLSNDALRCESSIHEKQLIDLEEVILSSRLPLNQLWLRIESLRENCHWVSVDRKDLELIGDSHRFVSPEDVMDFVHPMQTSDSNFRLAIYAMYILKVPLLPTSSSILKDLGLDKCSWTIDSIEYLLPILYPAAGELAGYKQRQSMLEGLIIGGLTSGPQYLRYHPAQEPYLDFLRVTFRALAENLEPNHRISLYVWWMRFERMLLRVSKDELKSDSRRKKIKGILKEFLKKEENRYNPHFYREYALIEREIGSYDTCVYVLEQAIEATSVTSEADQTALLSLRRTFLEVLLNKKNYNQERKARVMEILSQLVPGNTQKDNMELVEAYLRECFNNFLAQTPSNEIDTLDTYFLPNPICDIIACYAYLLYVTDRNIFEILSMFDACLKHTKGISYLQERFYVNEIIILQLLNDMYYSDNKILVKRLTDALKFYPDNFYLLSVLAGIEMELPTWKLCTRKENDKPWHALAFYLSGRSRLNSFVKRNIVDAIVASTNKLFNFHRALASTPETQHCPLAWRLLMLVLREQNLCEVRGEEIYHESVAQCPWTRSIYIDAAEIAPQVLTQIQDVIREKDLRMHVTPEELDILRG